MRVVAFCVALACLQTLLPAAELVSSFQAGEGSWHLGTLGTGNLDSSPGLEIVVPYRSTTGSWHVDAFKHNGQRLAGFPYSAGADPMNVSPTIADLTGDGIDEIIFTRANSIIALRANGSVLWSNIVSAANYVPTGGFHTVTNGFYWSPSGQFLQRLPSTAAFYSEVSPPFVADLSGSGKLEVLTAWKIDPDPASSAQDYNPHIFQTYGAGEWGLMGETWSGGVVSHDATTGAQTFAYHMHHLVESGLTVGRATRSGALHIYELNDSDSVVAFDKSKPHGLWGKGMLHKQFGKNQRLMSGSYHYPVDIQAADIDGDGLDEVLVPGIQISQLGWQPNETILDDDGSILWRRWLPQTNILNTAGWGNSASMIPVNPDKDNRADILCWHHGYEVSFKSWNGATMEEKPGWPINFFPFLPTPPVVGDVDGDGAEEIVIGTYNPTAPLSNGSLNIYALDGTLELSLPVVGGVKHVPALADVRGLNRCDVVFRTTLGRVLIYNFGSSSFKNPSWATHRGTMRRDGKLGTSLYPAGTPIITSKKSGSNRASFTWTNSTVVNGYAIYRADSPQGPFSQIAALPASATSYSDAPLAPGVQYYYEVAAEYGSTNVRSAPFTVLSLLNGNLLANSGFEECDNSHWDKWYTGSLGMTNMVSVATERYQGQRSMRLVLSNQASSGSIAQFNQYGIPDSTIYVTPGTFYSFGGFIKSGGLSAPSEHWLEWGSAKTGMDTSARPALPWPYFFTAPVVLGTNASEWVFMNRTFRLPQGFPNIELFHNFNMQKPGSGSVFLDNVFFRQLPAPDSADWISLVPFGSTWSYRSDTPPSDWASASFNDASWAVGRAKFGAGSGPTNIVTSLPQLKPAYYFRTRFIVPGDVEELLLSATCTDDSGSQLFPLLVFINGTQINATVDTVTSQGNEIRYFDLMPFAHLLKAGTNVLAVKIANHWGGWDDVAFDVSLKAVPAAAQSCKLSIDCKNPAAPRITFNTQAGLGWKLQSRDENGAWQTVQAGTNAAGGFQTVVDSGQNGRQPPSRVKRRFYRVVAP